ncbi:YdcH family protein [Psychrobacter sp. I-STPA10]|uniref:YdcH family protein n=1 Tax=Psychrobacter sp. I-STPA10 TaxID=2585769 RepID=UPI001E5132E8|nr:DUF465 domain-containing protein [Psychrobacter sp. I-STPA10]
MFHEHRELISELKQTDAHFAKLFDEHNDLDNEIDKLENDVVKHASREEEIEIKKRQKLHLKDEIYKILESHKK